MSRWWVAVGAVVLCGVAGAQVETPYSRVTTYSGFVSYSNNSSHMVIGQERNRKLAGLGVGYSRRLVHKRLYDFNYEAELRPVTFVRDPTVSGVTTFTVQGTPANSDVPVGPQPFSGPGYADCASGTTVSTGRSKQGVAYTRTVQQVCGERWTYTGGFSPLGVRFNALTRHRVQPYFAGNGGVLVAPRDVPVNFSSNFNFTFEVGLGVEWYGERGRSVAFDYRVHHLSNAYTGYYNPGIDSGVFRVGYRFGR